MSRIEELIAEYCPDGVPFKTMADVFRMKAGQNISATQISPVKDDTHPYPCYGGNGVRGFVEQSNHDGLFLLVGRQGALSGNVKRVTGRYYATEHAVVVDAIPEIDVSWAFHLLVAANLNQYVSKGAQPGLAVGTLARVRIPVPPIEVQREIAKILDKFTELAAELAAELEARRRQYEHYRSELLTFDDDTKLRPLGDVAENLDRKRKPVTRGARTPGNIPYYGASGVVDYVSDFIFDGDFLLVSEDGANLLARSTPIAFSISGKTWVNNHAHVLRFETYAERRFTEFYLNSIDLSPFISGAAQPKLNKANLNQILIPDPSFNEKERVVGLLDKFDALVNDLSVGLPAELAARRKQYEYYRDRLLTFEEATA
ncbi:restriction endonuclease subunit S [Arthrobacter sp. TMN-49]